MRSLVCLVFAVGCGSAAPAPATPPAQPAATDDSIAPRPFTAAQLRAGMPVGLVLVYEFRAPGQPAYRERWTVTGSTADEMTMATVKIAADGTEEARPPATSKWTALADHGAFPAAKTKIVDSTTTVPAGTFATRRYEVTDGSDVKRLHFAPTLAGPPIRIEVEKAGAPVLEAVLVSRQ